MLEFLNHAHYFREKAAKLRFFVKVLLEIGPVVILPRVRRTLAIRQTAPVAAAQHIARSAPQDARVSLAADRTFDHCNTRTSPSTRWSPWPSNTDRFSPSYIPISSV